MTDVLLDQKNNLGLKRILNVAKWISPAILVTQLILIKLLIDHGSFWLRFVITTVVVNSISVAILVSVSGWVFRQSLKDYFEGKFIFWVALFSPGTSQRPRHLRLFFTSVCVRPGSNSLQRAVQQLAIRRGHQ